MNEEKRVLKIEIQDARRVIYGELNFGRQEPGKGVLREMLAGNDQGKSTLHDVVTAFYENGKHPDLIRHGCERAVSVMYLSDGVVINRIHEPNESTYDIVGANGVKINAPVSYLKKLTRLFSLDPLAFDRAEPEKQVKYLLEMSDIEFPPAEIKESIGEAAALVELPKEPLTLQTFGRFLKVVTDTRAATGNRQKEQASMAEGLRKTLLPADQGKTPRNWKLELDALNQAAAVLDREQLVDIEDIQDQVKPRRDAINAKFAAREKKAREALQRILSGLAELKSEQLEALAADESAAINLVKGKTATARESNAAKIGEATVAFQAQAGAEANRSLMAKTEATALKLAGEWDLLDAAAKELVELQKSKLEQSFIPGMEVRDGIRIHINGIPWSEQNQASRLMKALEIVANGVGDMGLVTIDHGESLDINTKRILRAAVETSGLQVIMFSVAPPEWIAKHGPELQFADLTQNPKTGVWELVPAGHVNLKLAPKKPRKAMPPVEND